MKSQTLNEAKIISFIKSMWSSVRVVKYHMRDFDPWNNLNLEDF